MSSDLQSYTTTHDFGMLDDISYLIETTQIIHLNY